MTRSGRIGHKRLERTATNVVHKFRLLKKPLSQGGATLVTLRPSSTFIPLGLPFLLTFRPPSELLSMSLFLRSMFAVSCVVSSFHVVVAGENTKLVFRDVAEEMGLFPAAAEIFGHGAGWGDADGDGFVDLFVSTFGDKADSKKNVFFLQRDGKFVSAAQPALEYACRGNTALFVDLDNDGDLDLYVSSMPQAKKQIVGCKLFRNDGAGKYADITTESGACPEAFGGRSVSALDYDGDGLLDLLVGEDPLKGYNGSPTLSSRLFHNDGNLKFTDVSRGAGLPEGVPGHGTCASDFNDDGLPDFFLSATKGGNKMFLNVGGGKFREATELNELFAWPNASPKRDDYVCGVATGDVNLDGKLDLIVGPHFDSPWRDKVGPRLFINRGGSKESPKFEEATEAVGITPLPLKTPHVEIQDFNNDGLPDVLVSIVKYGADGKGQPIIFRNTGIKNGLPKFVLDGWDVNDFPKADEAAKSGGQFYKDMIANHQITYTAPAPTADFNNDGKLDIFFGSWWTEQKSQLMKNETPGGKWLQVVVAGDGKKVNKQGIGAKIRLYEAGKIGDPAALIGCKEMAIGFGYVSGQPAIAHFGLGERATVDVEVTLPHGRGKLERKNVAADQRIVIE